MTIGQQETQAAERGISIQDVQAAAGFTAGQYVERSRNPNQQGEVHAYYVAPVFVYPRGHGRVLVGWRLSGALPASGGQQRYYFRKGFHLADVLEVAELQRYMGYIKYFKEDKRKLIENVLKPDILEDYGAPEPVIPLLVMAPDQVVVQAKPRAECKVCGAIYEADEEPAAFAKLGAHVKDVHGGDKVYLKSLKLPDGPIIASLEDRPAAGDVDESALVRQDAEEEAAAEQASADEKAASQSEETAEV